MGGLWGDPLRPVLLLPNPHGSPALLPMRSTATHMCPAPLSVPPLHIVPTHLPPPCPHILPTCLPPPPLHILPTHPPATPSPPRNRWATPVWPSRSCCAR